MASASCPSGAENARAAPTSPHPSARAAVILVRFSPVHDAALPEIDGLLLGGGYPEERAAALAASAGMREAVRRLAEGGWPVYAERGGLTCLCRAIRTRDGAEHEMVGLVSGAAAVGSRLAALEYAEVETRRDTLLGPAGLRFRGHQLRHSALEGVPRDGPRAYAVRGRRGGEPALEGHGEGSVLASCLHAHRASSPAAAEGQVRACAAAKGAR